MHNADNGGSCQYWCYGQGFLHFGDKILLIPSGVSEGEYTSKYWTCVISLVPTVCL